MTRERELSQQIVGALSGAGVCARKDFGMRHDKSFSNGIALVEDALAEDALANARATAPRDSSTGDCGAGLIP